MLFKIDYPIGYYCIYGNDLFYKSKGNIYSYNTISNHISTIYDNSNIDSFYLYTKNIVAFLISSESSVNDEDNCCNKNISPYKLLFLDTGKIIDEDEFKTNAAIETTNYVDYSVTIGGKTIPFSDYPNYSYWTTTGYACDSHDSCKRYYYDSIKDVTIDLYSWQCMSFAHHVFYRLFGYVDRQNSGTGYLSGSYNTVVSNVAADTITVNYLKSILNVSVLPGAHIRTKEASGGNGHSLIFMGCDDTNVYTYEGNIDGHCRVAVNKRTWSEFATYLTITKPGIEYIHMPTNYPETAPTMPTLTSNFSVCGMWSNATFNFSAPGATRIIFNIYHNYGAELYFIGEFSPDSSYTRQFGETGQYSCNFTAYYPNGTTVDSNWVGFTVVDDMSVYYPATPDVWVSKFSVVQDEEFTLYFWSEKASFYRVNISLEGNLLSSNDYYVSSATVSFPTIGNYTVRVAAINSYGDTYGYTSFVVSTAIPDKPYVSFSSDSVAQNEMVTINFWSERASRYWVGISKDGILLVDEYTYFGNYTKSFSEIGTYNVTIAADNMYGYKATYTSFLVYTNAPIKLSKSSNSTAVIRQDINSIYGLKTGLTKYQFINNYVQIEGYARLEYSTNLDTLGTGSKVNVINIRTNTTNESYTVIIFGDVNGDGNITGLDAGTLVNIENYALQFDPVTDAALIKAADVNGDGNINGLDAGILVDVENYVRTIDQTTGLAI